MERRFELLSGGRVRVVIVDRGYFLQHNARSQTHADDCALVMERMLSGFLAGDPARPMGTWGSPLRYLKAEDVVEAI